MQVNPWKILFPLLIGFFFSSLILQSLFLGIVLTIITALTIVSFRFPLFFLISLVIIYEKGFETINIGIPHWMYIDFVLIILGFGLLTQFLRNKFQVKELMENNYLRYILFILVLVHFCILFGSYLVFKQPPLSLLFKARPYYIYFIFLYLFMAKFDRIRIKHFLKFCLYSATIVSILAIIDAKLLGGGKIFNLAMSNGISGARAGSIRISVYCFIITWTYFYLLSAIKSNTSNSKRVFYFAVLLLILFQLVFIDMGRQLFISIFLTTIIFLFRLKTNWKIIIFCFFVVLFLFIILIFLNYNDQMRSTFFYKVIDITSFEAAQSQRGNIAIRLNGLKYFFPYFAKTGFLGMGLMSSTYMDSIVKVGLSMGYNFADFGIFSTLFRFGIFSIILIFLLLFKIFRDLLIIYYRVRDIETKIIIESIFYLFLSKIIFIPSSTLFFREAEILYYGILFYFIYKIKKETVQIYLS